MSFPRQYAQQRGEHVRKMCLPTTSRKSSLGLHVGQPYARLALIAAVDLSPSSRRESMMTFVKEVGEPAWGFEMGEEA